MSLPDRIPCGRPEQLHLRETLWTHPGASSFRMFKPVVRSRLSFAAVVLSGSDLSRTPSVRVSPSAFRRPNP